MVFIGVAAVWPNGKRSRDGCVVGPWEAAGVTETRVRWSAWLGVAAFSFGALLMLIETVGSRTQ